MVERVFSLCILKKQRDIKIAFLQTEEGFYSVELYRKIGFKDACNVYYFAKKELIGE